MSPRRTDVRDFESLFVYELEAVYDMEVRLVDALDEMAGLTTNDNLAKGFAIHRTETEEQVGNVEEAFESLGRDPTRRENRIVDGLVAEQERIDDRVADGALRDVSYLYAAIRTERVEITSYETLLATAKRGGLEAGVTEPLSRNLEQEEKTLRKLEGLADRSDREPRWKRFLGS